MGVFSKNHYPNNKPSRNTFDLSHRNHLTLDFGSLIPVLCQEVIPGDTFEINTDFLLRFMPLAFPVQTQIRADIHYFYVRNRNLWEDWMNFIGMTGDTSKISMPTIQSGMGTKFGTGTLVDYLGVPSTIVGDNETSIGGTYNLAITPYGAPQVLYVDSNSFLTDNMQASTAVNSGLDSYLWRPSDYSPSETHFVYGRFVIGTPVTKLYKGDVLNLKVHTCKDGSNGVKPVVYLFDLSGNKISALGKGVWTSYDPTTLVSTFKVPVLDDITLQSTYNLALFSEDAEPAAVGQSEDMIEGSNVYNFMPSGYTSQTALMSYGMSFSLDSVAEFKGVYPFKLNALPFRAYESIYNAFYRDNRNNPYLVNGINDPNVYLPTKAGGIDGHEYTIHRRNWEQDFLTSAVPSPQQGVAPLVGLTSTGVASYASDDGTIYNVKMNTADDGDTIVSADITSNLPNDVKRSVVEVASQGISINDFRGVNALQCWLERNMRNGLKYKDQIASHFGVEPSYAELDMPEFIGGVSQIVDIQQVNQTSPSGDDPLGSYAGQAYAFGSSKHKVSHYCDEHGYIIGILSVVPVPSYSQLLPKHFTKTQPLDYFTPEFGHIGMQPIPYLEVCPLQAYRFGGSLSRTFGYQRAWYDYLANFDQVHGQFRTTLKDFILQRQFNQIPSLNPDFLLVSSEQLNDIFTVNEVDDADGNKVPVQPILGAIQFDIKAKRPIPRFGIPRLE